MKPRDPTCERVAERVALGEPLGEHADHLGTCEPCRALVATTRQLADVPIAADPGIGFAARMTVGAQRRFDLRRRRRLAGGIAGTVVAVAVGVFVVARAPASPPPVAIAPHPHDADPPAPRVEDPDVNAAAIRALVRFSDVDHNRQLGARWGRIERPLDPYRALVKGK